MSLSNPDESQRDIARKFLNFSSSTVAKQQTPTRATLDETLETVIEHTPQTDCVKQKRIRSSSNSKKDVNWQTLAIILLVSTTMVMNFNTNHRKFNEQTSKETTITELWSRIDEISEQIKKVDLQLIKLNRYILTALEKECSEEVLKEVKFKFKKYTQQNSFGEM